jgi:hypothetical protein
MQLSGLRVVSRTGLEATNCEVGSQLTHEIVHLLLSLRRGNIPIETLRV